MIFISQGWPLETHDICEMEVEKHKQKTEMKVRNERVTIWNMEVENGV